MFPLEVGDKVEDRRPKKLVFVPTPPDLGNYPGYPGTVVETTDTVFRVKWEPSTDPENIEFSKQLGLKNEGYEMGYGWAFWEYGIRRPDQF